MASLYGEGVLPGSAVTASLFVGTSRATRVVTDVRRATASSSGAWIVDDLSLTSGTSYWEIVVATGPATTATYSVSIGVEGGYHAPTVTQVVLTSSADPDSLATLSDVSVTSPADTQVLTYDHTAGKWKNAAGTPGPSGPGTLTVVTPAKSVDFTAADGMLYTVDATAGAVAVTIPHAAGAKFMVIRVDNAPSHAVTLTPDSGSIESGGGTFASKTLNAQGAVAYMIGDGTNVQDVQPNTYGGDGSFRNLTVGAANTGGVGLFTAGDDFLHAGDALGFYGTSVQTKQAVTGALSAVTDVAAKAVLTSIITDLAAIGLFTNSTS